MTRERASSYAAYMLAMLLVVASASAGYQKSAECSLGETGHPITTTDEVWWPDTPGAVRIEVLGNDYDLEGDPLKVVAPITIAPGVGSAVITADQRAVLFTPAPTRPAANVTFTYTASDGVRTSPGTVRLLVAQPEQVQESLSFTVECDNLLCYFKAVPVGIPFIRMYSWDLPGQPWCSKPEWRALTFSCGFTEPRSGVAATLTAWSVNGKRYTATQTFDVALKDGVANWHVVNAPVGRPSVTESLEILVNVDESAWATCSSCKHQFDFGEGPLVDVSYDGSWTRGAGYIYSKPGVYNVRLLVNGVSKVFAKQIEVRNQPPLFHQFQVGHPYLSQVDLIQLTLEPDDEHAPGMVGGFPTDPGPLAPKTVEISWGDGTSASVEVPWGGGGFEHRYTAPGTFTVLGRITDTVGAIGTATDEVTIENVRPVADLTFDCDPFTRYCTFDASVSKDNGGAITQYRWTLTSPAGEQQFVQTTPQLGASLTGHDAWTVMLTVTDDQGLGNSFTQPVRFSSSTSPALAYYTMAPKIALDTRTDGQRVTPSAPRVIDLKTCCQIDLPGDAAAVISVSAIDPQWPSTPAGPVDLFVAAGTQLINDSPLLRYDNKLAPISSNVVVPTSGGKFVIGNKGGASPYPTGVHLLVSVVGILAPPAFVPPAGLAGPSRFVPVEPCRALDTRFAPPRPAAGADRKLLLRGACGIGSDAVGVTGHLTVVNPTSTSPINIFASNLSGGNGTSALEAVAGFARANGVWPVLGRTATDDLTLRVGTGASDVILDTSGYFRPAAAGGMRYFAVKPCLAGSVSLPVGQQKTVKIAGNCGVPANASAAVLTHHVSAPYFSGHLAAYGSYREPPVSSNGNFTANAANAYTTSTSVVKLNASADGDAALIAYYATVFPPPAPGNAPTQQHLTTDIWVWGYFWDENFAPVARLVAQCSPPGPMCEFNASASTDDQNAILEYRWDFGDGTSQTTTKPTASHLYAGSAESIAAVTAWDGFSSSAPATVVVNANAAPVPHFAFNCFGRKCHFDAGESSDDGAITKYEWIVQPYGAFAALPASWTYTYANDWDYTVQLRVTDDRGKSATTARVVQVRGEAGIGPANFFTVPQCRLYDSGTAGVYSAVVTARGVCGVPAGSDAIVPVVNVSIMSSEPGPGEFTIYVDDPHLKVPFTSATLPLAFHRLVKLPATASTFYFGIYPRARVIADVVGYYRVSESADPPPAKGPFRFTALDPCRVIDSRTTPPALSADSRTDVSVAGTCGVPAGAAATAQSLTGINPQTPGGPSFMRLFSSHLTTVATPAIHLLHGSTRSNFFISELGTANGASKDLAVWLSSGSADYGLDTHGYYSAGSRQKYTHLSYPVPQKETPVTLQPGVKRTFKIKGHSGVPMHASAVVVQAAVWNASAAGHLTLFAGDKAAPLAAAVAFNANVATPATNMVIVPLSRAPEGDLGAMASASSSLSLTVVGYFSDPTDWGSVVPDITWTASAVGARLDLDVTSINLPLESPDHTYYIDWGDGTERTTFPRGSALLDGVHRHVYASGGQRDVTVAVLRLSDGGAEARFTKRIYTGNTAPVAALTFDCTAGTTCTFDASGSTDDYNEIQRYNWTIPGGSTQTSTPYLTHQFPAPGTYEIAVTAWDGALESAAFNRTIQVRAAGPKTQYLFQPIRPCRVYDSRVGAALTSGVAGSVKVTEGSCGVPTIAKAVALSVAVVTPSGDGYLRIHEPGQLTAVANINFTPASAPRSNHATSSISADGKVGVLFDIAGSGATAGTAHLVVDVTGYYIADGAGVPASMGVGFRTLVPCRIRDSRLTPQLPLVSGTPTLFKVRGQCGIPDSLPPEGAAAVAINLTGIMPATIGNLTISPSNGPEAVGVSTVNVLANRNTAGGATVGLGRQPGDDVTMRYTSTGPGNAVHWAMDATGYFAAGNELRYYPVAGCRMLDTRVLAYGHSRLAPNVEQRVQARGQCGIPRWAKALMVNAVVIGGESGGNLLLWPAGTSAPVTSIVNWIGGEPAISNMTIVPLGAVLPDVSVKTAQSGGHLVLDVFGYYANPADVPAGYFITAQGEQDQ